MRKKSNQAEGTYFSITHTCCKRFCTLLVLKTSQQDYLHFSSIADAKATYLNTTYWQYDDLLCTKNRYHENEAHREGWVGSTIRNVSQVKLNICMQQVVVPLGLLFFFTENIRAKL
jgi:hypothetical protein